MGNMRTIYGIAGIGLFVLLAAPRAFAANEIEPGLWQDMEITTVDGKREPAKTSTNCVTAQDAQDPVKLIKDSMKDQAGQCSKFNVQTNGNVVLFEMNCGDPKQGSLEMTMTYTVHSPRSTSSVAKSTMSIAGQKIVSNLSTESIWMAAACKK
jgi:hypothetical protein